MNKWLKITVVAAVCTACFGGCLKGYEGDIVYVLKPYVSDGSVNGDMERYIMAYAVYADTTNWTVASYDDALAMRVTEKVSGSELEGRIVEAEPFVESDGGGRYAVEMTLRPATVMLVAVDTELKIYGYREQTLPEGLKSIFDSVVFYTSRNARRYKAGQWMMCNDFYVAPEPDPEPDPEPEPEPDDPNNDPDNGDDEGDGDDDDSADGGDDGGDEDETQDDNTEQ